MSILLLSLLFICHILVHGADTDDQSSKQKKYRMETHKALQTYESARYSNALPLFEQLLNTYGEKTRVKTLHAECQAAVSFKTGDPQALRHAMQQISKDDIHYQEGNGHGDPIAVADHDFGTVIFYAYYLKQKNMQRIEEGKQPLRLHLKGKTKLLLKLLLGAHVTSHITTDPINDEDSTRCQLPPTAWMLGYENHFFQKHEPYLEPDEQALAYWQKRVDAKKFNVAVAWRPAVNDRSLPLQTLLQAILQDPEAHVYLTQGPPNSMLSKSAFDALDPQQQNQRTYDWISDDLYDQWQHRITVVQEQHGPFIDTTALLTQMPYIGCGTALLHIAGSVKDGKAAVIIPERNDGTSNFYWRMGEPDERALNNEGQQVPGHGKHIRLFSYEPMKDQVAQFARIVHEVKTWTNS